MGRVFKHAEQQYRSSSVSRLPGERGRSIAGRKCIESQVTLIWRENRLIAAAVVGFQTPPGDRRILGAVARF